MALTAKTIQILSQYRRRKSGFNSLATRSSVRSERYGLNAGKEGVFQIVDQFTVQNINLSEEGNNHPCGGKIQAEKLSDLMPSNCNLVLGFANGS